MRIGFRQNIPHCAGKIGAAALLALMIGGQSLSAQAAFLDTSIGLAAQAPELVPDGSIFDPEYYAASNPDVVAVYGTAEYPLYLHYMTIGRYEGRRACAPGTEAVSAYDSMVMDYPYAVAVLDEVGWDLRAAFDWSTGLTYYGHGKPDMPENGAPGARWFAEFGFTKLKGNCYVMAATFYEMAKLLGYEPRQMTGLVPSSRGGLTPHSWVEIDHQGVTYVYDPDFTYGTGRNGYMIQYRQPGTWRYEQYTVMSE